MGLGFALKLAPGFSVPERRKKVEEAAKVSRPDEHLESQARKLSGVSGRAFREKWGPAISREPQVFFAWTSPFPNLDANWRVQTPYQMRPGNRRPWHHTV